MVKFSFTDKKNSQVLGLGLSKENIDRLMNGMPILIKSFELTQLTGWEGSILIMYGDTEEGIEKQLSLAITEQTKIINRNENE